MKYQGRKLNLNNDILFIKYGYGYSLCTTQMMSSVLTAEENFQPLKSYKIFAPLLFESRKKFMWNEAYKLRFRKALLSGYLKINKFDVEISLYNYKLYCKRNNIEHTNLSHERIFIWTKIDNIPFIVARYFFDKNNIILAEKHYKNLMRLKTYSNLSREIQSNLALGEFNFNPSPIQPIKID